MILAILGAGFAILDLTFPNDLLRVAAGFPLGMVAFQIARRCQAAIARVPWVGLALAIAIITWLMFAAPGDTLVALPLFLILIIALSSKKDWLGRGLSTKLLIYLGEVSYSVYMFHWVARVIIRTALEKVGVFYEIPAPLMIAFYSAGTLVGAILLYHFVEKPGRSKLRSLGSPRLAARSAAADVAVTTP
jgi:peptidoglycan/LPS O-acetylase OafA/YrhL